MATQDSRWPEAMARDGARAEAAAVDAPVSSAQLFISHGTEHVAVWPLNVGRVSIGRAPENDLRLDARFISRRHCQVVTVGSVSTIEDLDSVNGMTINGKVAKRHVLQHADQITLGEYVLTYLVS
jgi:pSer/pThr/pTyr-binding forkhead associated (FHA) protein